MKKVFTASLLAAVLATTAVGCAQYDTSARLASREWVTPGPAPTYEHPNFTLIPPGVR